MAIIQLDRGCQTLVDDADFAEISKYRWHTDRNGYAARCFRGTTVWIHRFLLNATRGSLVDHINRDPLDNRRANLRFATHAENSRNRRGARRSSSGRKGVTWHAKGNKWQASIKVGVKPYYLGLFTDLDEAADAYAAAAKKYFGEFANTQQRRGAL